MNLREPRPTGWQNNFSARRILDPPTEIQKLMMFCPIYWVIVQSATAVLSSRPSPFIFTFCFILKHQLLSLAIYFLWEAIAVTMISHNSWKFLEILGKIERMAALFWKLAKVRRGFRVSKRRVSLKGRYYRCFSYLRCFTGHSYPMLGMC